MISIHPGGSILCCDTVVAVLPLHVGDCVPLPCDIVTAFPPHLGLFCLPWSLCLDSTACAAASFSLHHFLLCWLTLLCTRSSYIALSCNFSNFFPSSPVASFTGTQKIEGSAWYKVQGSLCPSIGFTKLKVQQTDTQCYQFWCIDTLVKSP